MLVLKSPPFLGRVDGSVRRQVAVVRVLIGQLGQYAGDNLHDHAEERSHTSSASRDGTNGVSVVLAFRVPPRMPTHTRMESIRMVATSTRKIPVTAASSRALKTSAAVSAVCGPAAS